MVLLLLGVQVDEVPQLMTQQTILINGNRQLTQLLDDSIFCGSNIDIKANKIFINIIDMTKNETIINNPKMKPYLNFLSFLQVNNSLATLNSTFIETSELADQYNATYNKISIECQGPVNNVVISLNHTDDETNAAFIDDTKKLNPIPIIYYPEIQKNEGTVNLPIKKPMKSQDIVYRVLGGESIYNIDRVGCTAGFWVRFRTLELLVTAGHCPDFRLIGSMIIRFTRPVDRGFIIRNSTHISATPFIINWFGQEYRIAGIELPDTEGAIVCKSGYHSEVNCGTLFAIYGDLIHADGTSHDNVIIVEGMECVRGDSGGPAFTVNEFTFNVILSVWFLAE
ncbi:3570_t:CDS:2 [Gigaspora margarita]|uniref:3570_t:CDS:1 n=1 Tax=Gigaspora margarita TaxID=4874 RepID=A0ABN7UC83_GIGMA|nr:3570_t:CDS:2 [Gigaspora margarita]